VGDCVAKIFELAAGEVTEVLELNRDLVLAD
jgi:hypothetical protein